MSAERLRLFQQAYRDLDLFPLVDPEQIENFRVSYGDRVLARLRSVVPASENTDQQRNKIIFAGPRGCGKSTLLKAFAVEMQKDYVVVFFSVADSIEMSDVTHVNILYTIGVRLLSTASKLKIDIPRDIQASLLRWMDTTRTTTEETTTKAEVGIGAEILGVGLKLQRERAFREELERKYEKRISELVGKLDRLAGLIQSKINKPVLVVIDDLDKLDLSVVETIYRDNVKALFSPAFRIVFTMPVSAIRESYIMRTLESESVALVQFPVTKFFTREDCHNPKVEPNARELKLFEDVLQKRFSSGLLAPGIARKIALLSGGVIRELMRLARECCTECMIELDIDSTLTDLQIDDQILKTATGNLRNNFAREMGSQSLYDIAAQVYMTSKLVEGEGFTRLLHSLMILEYENGELWYDVHPLVLDLLRREKMIDAPTD
jgi:energy-coupling factor transporter ATP-binding protein EcfA2